MKSKSIKKLLAATLSATMIMAMTLTAAASSGSAGSAGSSSSAAESAGSSSGSSEESAAPVEEPVQVVSVSAAVKVAGTTVKTSVGGAYSVKTLQGAAVVTPVADLQAKLGLKDSQTPYIVVFDTDAKKSHLAMDCVNTAATALGGKVVTAINANLSAKENGKLVSLSSGSVGMVVGLPKTADTSKTYSVVCVQPGGVVTVLKDQDDSPATVTFEVKAGLATYGVVAQ